jgi:hypothetical protein
MRESHSGSPGIDAAFEAAGFVLDVFDTPILLVVAVAVGVGAFLWVTLRRGRRFTEVA